MWAQKLCCSTEDEEIMPGTEEAEIYALLLRTQKLYWGTVDAEITLGAENMTEDAENMQGY